MENKPVLAIIVPCFNEEEVVKPSYFELSSVLQKLIELEKISSESYICFVDDGSEDKTWEKISKLSKYNDAKGINLSKNFGHQAAQLAGLTNNEADIFITIDADLQDDITLIPKMIEKYLQGYEIVYGVRNNRKNDGFLKKNLAQIYYKISKLVGIPTIYNHADFRLMSKIVIEHLKNFNEYNIYLRGLIANLGFKSDKIYYARKPRIAGKSKYKFLSSFKLAVDGITSFSAAPLKFITLLGFISFLIAVVMSFYSIVVYIENKIVPGWASLFVSIYFLGGIQLLSIGIIGEYIGKIYQETKQRPKFIIEEKVG